MTTDDIIRMAQESWVFPEAHIPNILEFANLVAAAEREACAQICEALDDGSYAGGDQPYGIHYARAIRARGQR